MCSPSSSQFPGLQGKLLLTFLHFYLWAPQSPHLLCQSAPHRAFAAPKVREHVTSQSQVWRALLGGTTHTWEGECSKSSAYSVLLTMFDSPSETQFSQLRNPLAHICWGEEIPDTVTILQVLQKTSDYVLERPSSPLMSVPQLQELLQWALSTYLPGHTPPTQLRPYVWPIYMGRAPTKTCSKLRDINLREAMFLLLTKLPNRPAFPVSAVLQHTQLKTRTS